MPTTKEHLANQSTDVNKSKRSSFYTQNLLYLLLPYIREVEAKSILDYGCEQSFSISALNKELGDKITNYRYSPEKETVLPEQKIDLTICTNVLERVNCTKLEQTIQKILALGEQTIFIVSTKNTKKILHDCTNANCSLYHKTWYLDAIQKHTEFAKIIPWPVSSSFAIITWDSKAVGGKFDSLIKYFAGNTGNFFKK